MMDVGPPDRGQSSIGLRNRQEVLKRILLSGPLPRTRIADEIGLTQSSVSRITRDLLAEGLIQETAQAEDNIVVRPGRRTVPLDIDPQGGQVMGIGIGPTIQTVTLTDLKNRVIERTHLELETIEDPDHVVRQVVRECQRMIGTLPRGRERLLGCLFMVAASLDPSTGSIVSAPDLRWSPYPLGARFSEALDLPVKVRSLATTIAHTEMLFGAARGRSSVLTLICGLGIGAALILDGRLIESGNLMSGEIGRFRIAGEDGDAGTLSHLATGLGVLRRLHGEDMTPDRAPVADLARALLDAIDRDRAGDAEVSALMSSAGRELGRALIQFTLLNPPELALIAGPLAKSASYVDGARQATAEGATTHRIDVLASGSDGSLADRSASCAMALYEFLIERSHAPGQVH